MQAMSGMVDLQRLIESRIGAPIALRCETHGEYTGYDLERTCPTCAEIEDERQRQRDARKRVAAVLAKRWAESGMPEKFCGVTMDDWVVTMEAQRKAKARVQDFVDGRLKRMLLIGSTGTGKTMLAAAAITTMTQASDCKPVYTTGSRLIRSIRDSWRKKDVCEQTVMDRFITADVLVVDELGAGRCTEDDRLIISEVLCDRYSADLPTLLISNLPASQIKTAVLDERAVDRMREGGAVVAMNWRSLRGQKTA